MDRKRNLSSVRNAIKSGGRNEAVHACIDDALDAAGFSALREDVQHENLQHRQ